MNISKETDYTKMNNNQIVHEIETVQKKHEIKKEEMLGLLDRIDVLDADIAELEKNYVQLVDLLSERINGEKISEKIKKENKQK